MFENAIEEWLSMCTDEMELIWKTESKELRRAVMVFYALKQEFSSVEHELNGKIKKFKQQSKVTDDLQKIEESTDVLLSSPDLFSIKQKDKQTSDSVKIIDNCTKEIEENKSPKINKHRKFSRLKKLNSSPSLLDISKENKSKAIIPECNTRKGSEVLFNSDKTIGVLLMKDNNKKINKCPSKTTPEINMSKDKIIENDNIIDTSVFIEEPRNNSMKKKERNRTQNSKLLHNKTGKTKEKVNTITQMFVNMTSQNNDSTILTDIEPILNSDDDTYFVLDDDKCSKNGSPEFKKLKLEHLKDYDKIPLPKSKSPKHVHKTETVRRKADRKKLPGWSCAECQQYYENLNLSPKQLREKMNACSKHRNKFKVNMDETPKGYWDITMGPSQENSLNDSTIYEI